MKKKIAPLLVAVVVLFVLWLSAWSVSAETLPELTGTEAAEATQMFVVYCETNLYAWTYPDCPQYDAERWAEWIRQNYPGIPVATHQTYPGMEDGSIFYGAQGQSEEPTPTPLLMSIHTIRGRGK